MKDQEANVKSWEAGRRNLIDEQKFKRENERTHRAALYVDCLFYETQLTSLGLCPVCWKVQHCFVYGLQSPCHGIGTNTPQTPEREKEELEQYDAKVYRACKAMVESQTSSLKVLGVPFFGVKPYLVVGAAYDPMEVADAPSAPEGGKITKDQLLELQRKMLNHLMELYGD